VLQKKRVMHSDGIQFVTWESVTFPTPHIYKTLLLLHSNQPVK